MIALDSPRAKVWKMWSFPVFARSAGNRGLSPFFLWFLPLCWFALTGTDVLAARTINSATLNGGASVSVVAGASITAAVNVTTDGSGSNNDWESTGWLISTTPPGSLSCRDHGDHTDAGTYNESFSITAPTTAGTYNVYFVAHRDDGCTQGDSATFTLTNAVTVTPAMTINSATVDGGATTTVPAGSSVSVSYSVTIAGGDSEVEGTLWQIGTSPPPSTCADSAPDSPDNTNGTYDTAFTATAPTTPGTYNLYLIANTRDGCDGSVSSATFTLSNAVTVTTPTPIAYYAMDEGTWNGTANEVIDGSGNANHGRAIGTAKTASGGKVCRRGNIPANTTDAAQYAVDTGLDVDGEIGSTGTISFWYKSNAAWNGGGDRTLLDASSSSTDRYFSLILRDNGRLRFALEDSSDNDIVFDTSAYSYTSSDWVHIAVTWDMPNDRREIYVNGNLAASDTSNEGSSLGNLETLYLGDNRSDYHPDGSANSANGSIDEVYIYRSAVGQSQIQTDMNATHICTTPSTTCETFRDEFSSTSYSRNDGTVNWTGNWIESETTSSASSGNVEINNNRLQFESDASDNTLIYREANLSGYTTATLTFDYSESGWDTGDILEVRVSSDGGSSWTTLQPFEGDRGSGGTFSQDISSYIASNFRLAFRIASADDSNDEFYVDNVQIEACSVVSSLHHVRLNHTGSAVTCLGEQVTVTACASADTSGSCTVQAGALTGNVVARKDATTIVATVPFSIASGNSSTTVTVPVATAQTVTFETSGLSVTPSASQAWTCWNSGTSSDSCSNTFEDTGFIFASTAGGTEATIPTQTAGTTSSKYWLRAVKTADTNKGKACEAALTGSTAVTVSYQCTDPSSCYTTSAPACESGDSYLCLTPYSSDGVTAQTSVAVPPAGKSVTMKFDTNGNAPFKFNYRDVGKIVLSADKAASGSLVNPLSGNSNAFVVKPSGFVLSDIKQTASPNLANPGATDASGDKFVKAGEAFSATVTAKAGSGTAYSFGRETKPESVKLTSSLVSGLGLTNNPEVGGTATTGSIAAAGNSLVVASATGASVGATVQIKGAGASGDLWTTVTAVAGTTLTVATAAATTVSDAVVNFTFGQFANGVATGTGFTWSEVGIITLTPSVADGDYLGAGNVTGSASSEVGRFYPDHFDTTVSHACGTFTYSGQPFPLKVTARNSAGTTTGNYAGDFTKTVTPTDANGATGTFSPTTLAAADFSDGVADLTATPSVSFAYTNKPSAPSTLKVRVSDSDGATSSGGTEGTTALRFGRLRLSNAFGRKNAVLNLEAQTQYWTGSTWVLNNADSCTSIPQNSFFLSGGIQASTGVSGAVTIGGGNGTLTLTAPNTAGSVDIAANLGSGTEDQSCLSPHGGDAANLIWLRSRNGNCVATYDRDPSARATFGIYSPESRRTVHIREQF